MAKNNNQNTPEILELGQKMGLGIGTTKIAPSWPAQLGTQIPALGEISYMNRKMDQDSPGSGPITKMRNKMARSKRGGSQQETF